MGTDPHLDVSLSLDDPPVRDGDPPALVGRPRPSEVARTIGPTSSSYLYSYPSDPAISREAGEGLLEKFASRARNVSGAELRVLIGDPAESLLTLAEEEHAQLIVVGSRGRGALKTALLGSVSSTLTTRAPCPVVVVPPHAIEP